ncbi:MAG: DUF3048 domain-containing protein [Butyrivibrio sp.]|nr:DUF3048 domain-containing protein [Butyrivibrio sp.]
MLKKKLCSVALISVLAIAMVACGNKEAGDDAATSISISKIEEEADTSADEASVEATVEETDSAAEAASVPEGMYLSEMTGEPIDESLKDQRPIAAMVDNEKTALPHYGIAEADVVYELMNSTLNDRITRFMVMVKDWGNIKQLGSIRSTRPTNILLMNEWNAVLCHDGGPYYNDQYFKYDWAEHLSGVFSRVDNGKAREFTEYIVSGDLESNLASAGISETYNEYRNEDESHFNFTPWGTEINLDEVYDKTYDATDITLPFWHNGSRLRYNADTQTYDYYEYDSQHLDAEDSEPLTFKNVILQCCTFTQLDEHGYLIYNCIDSGQTGWYITNGKAKSISWVKAGETDITRYYDDNGEEIQINTGKTYISLIPSDTWGSVSFQ